jgi:hypothetical protein
MSIRASGHDVKMIDTMLGNIQIEKSEKSLGNYYLVCRKILQRQCPGFVGDNIINFADPQAKTKKESLIIANSKNIIEKNLNLIKNAISFDKFAIPIIAFNSEYIEFKGVGLLYVLWFLKTNYNKFTVNEKLTKNNFYIVANALLVTKKFIGYYDTKVLKNIIPSKDEEVSKVFIEDLKISLYSTQKLFNINNIEILEYCPDLIIGNNFGQYSNLINTELHPLDHQIELVKKVKNNFANGFFIVVDSIIGSGKTSTIIMLADLIKKLRIELKNNNLGILYVCSSEGVRNQVGCLC